MPLVLQGFTLALPCRRARSHSLLRHSHMSHVTGRSSSSSSSAAAAAAAARAQLKLLDDPYKKRINPATSLVL